MTQKQSLPAPRMLVLLCTHQGERYLPLQLRSLVEQTFAPEAVVVHDWGSTDGTRSLLHEFAFAMANRFAVHIVQHEQAPGPCASFLRALDQVLEEHEPFDLLLPCDQDDLWHPDKLRRIAVAWTAQPDTDLLYSDVRLVDAQGRVLTPSYIGGKGALARRQDINHVSSLFVNVVPAMAMALSRRFLIAHREAWRQPGWVMHDWAWIIVAHLTGALVLQLPEALVDYRQHASNFVGGQTPTAHCYAAPTLRATWLQARHRVTAIHAQYRQCAALPQRYLRWPLSRCAVLWIVLSGRHFNAWRTFKVALGLALLWPGRDCPETGRSEQRCTRS